MRKRQSETHTVRERYSEKERQSERNCEKKREGERETKQEQHALQGQRVSTFCKEEREVRSGHVRNMSGQARHMSGQVRTCELGSLYYSTAVLEIITSSLT